MTAAFVADGTSEEQFFDSVRGVIDSEDLPRNVSTLENPAQVVQGMTELLTRVVEQASG